MPYQPRISTLEYVLVIFVVIAAVVLFAAALSPILSLMIDGFKLASALLSGDAAAIGSLIPAAK